MVLENRIEVLVILKKFLPVLWVKTLKDHERAFFDSADWALWKVF